MKAKTEAGKWAPKSHWDNHPEYTADDWIQEVFNGDTRESYVEWVNNKLENEEWQCSHCEHFNSPDDDECYQCYEARETN